MQYKGVRGQKENQTPPGTGGMGGVYIKELYSRDIQKKTGNSPPRVRDNIRVRGENQV